VTYEDFTTYSEYDPFSRITKNSSRITATQFKRSEYGYVASDKGVGHFNGDFIHLFDMENTARYSTNAKYSCWALANELLNSEYAFDSSGTAECLLLWTGYYPMRFQLRNWVNGNLESYADISGSYSYGTPYYVKITRSGTTVKVEIYSDVERTNLVGDGSLAQNFVYSYQYIYGILGSQYSGSSWLSGYIENLSLEKPPVPKKLVLKLGATVGIALEDISKKETVIIM